MNRDELIAYVRQRGSGVVSTLGPDGGPQAAYLAIAATPLGELVFDARPDSRKIANIAADARVAVVIGGEDGTTLQAEGYADLPQGDELERCANEYLSAFPEFTASVRGGNVLVVRVRLEWARFGDYRDAEPRIDVVDLDGAARDHASS